MRERLSGSVKKPPHSYSKLRAMGEPQENQRTGRNPPENDAPSFWDSEAAGGSGTSPLIDSAPGTSLADGANSEVGGSRGTRGRRRRTDKAASHERQGVAHFAVLSDDTRLLVRSRGRQGQGDGGVKKSRSVVKICRQDINRTFRRGWHHILKNLSRLKF